MNKPNIKRVTVLFQARGCAPVNITVPLQTAPYEAEGEAHSHAMVDVNSGRAMCDLLARSIGRGGPSPQGWDERVGVRLGDGDAIVITADGAAS